MRNWASLHGNDKGEEYRRGTDHISKNSQYSYHHLAGKSRGTGNTSSVSWLGQDEAVSFRIPGRPVKAFTAPSF